MTNATQDPCSINCDTRNKRNLSLCPLFQSVLIRGIFRENEQIRQSLDVAYCNKNNLFCFPLFRRLRKARTPGVNFTSVLHSAFTLVGPKSVK